MARNSIYSSLDRYTSSLEPALVCNHKHLCSRKNKCKRKDFSGSNSVAFVALPIGKWDDCPYFAGEKNEYK